MSSLLILPCLRAGDAEPKHATVRGKLLHAPGGKPALDDGSRVMVLAGDESTEKVLLDPRLRGSDLEAIGHFEGTLFRVDPIHTRAMFIHREGKRLAVTYWCDVCYIRTYSPGTCWCCQADTRLDLIPPEDLPR